MTNLDKEDLRKQLIYGQREFSRERVIADSAIICQQIRSWDVWEDASCVHIYVTGKRNEVDTVPIIRDSLSSGKRVFVPQIGLKGRTPLRNISVGRNSISVMEISCLEELVDEYWGIPQPIFEAEKKETDWTEIDLVIVPGLAFDQSGNRIGYGSGYYDRFLPELRSKSVGLCFSENFFDTLPRAAHDAQVQYVMTESALHNIAS
ncbi:MAG: 5-formyltetrahydrofolate cyclo-ligase [Candidatus Latescibacterota bacterium]|nr:5-formyltetrahydrofolate cyclo-ligase [Candidatus Latescibacterota bacterium]